MNQNTKMLVGAVIAAALAFAVYYGLINQQTANNIQGQTNRTLGTSPPSQQTAPSQARPTTTQQSQPTTPPQSQLTTPPTPATPPATPH